MDLGIKGWDGPVATGIPEAGMSHFSSAATPQQVVALAWVLEEGSRNFYSQVAPSISPDSARASFLQLEVAEERHKATLKGEYERITKLVATEDFARRELNGGLTEDVMEGGMKISEALAWAKGRRVSEVLELVIALETNAYDLYVKMERSLHDESSKIVFQALAREERTHLQRVSDLLDMILGSDTE